MQGKVNLRKVLKQEVPALLKSPYCPCLPLSEANHKGVANRIKKLPIILSKFSFQASSYYFIIVVSVLFEHYISSS